MAHKIFKHSGDLGDIVFSLPAVRALSGGGGDGAILLLDPEGGATSPLVKFAPRTRTKLDARAIEQIAPVLRQQSYIAQVRPWAGESVDFDLDTFRQFHRFNNLSDAHLAAFGLPFIERDSPWMVIDAPTVIADRPIVISRNVRYQGNHNFWEGVLPTIRDRCIFVGYAKEHEIFEYTFGQKIEYLPTPDLLSLARVIAGCRQFIGNQGLPHAFAEAMKKKLVNEVDRTSPAAIFRRADAEYV